MGSGIKASRPSAPIVVAALALVAALAGTAFAGPDAPTTAVSKKKVKKLVKNEVAAQVAALELPPGPRGPVGPVGARGVPGAPGATNVRIRQAETSAGTTMNVPEGADPECLPGEVATGGGVSHVNIATTDFRIIRSTASGNDGATPTAWTGQVLPTVDDPNAQFFVKVVCASP